VRFRWDWLSAVLHVPYVPTLGAVHPQALSAELFEAVISVAATGEFLRCDKDQRWFAGKDEYVLVPEIIHAPEFTVIPTLATRGRTVLKIHHYARSAPDLESCPAAGTFGDFARRRAADGSAFLNERVTVGLSDGPVLVATQDHRVVGALGPLSTMTDATGQRTVPPQYFAVHPRYRRQGHGRALWYAAITWGQQHQAVYKILQAQTGTAAEQLYLSEGLTTLGSVCTQGIT
jgi:GNAT superfamily N-acetyltransferase